MADNENDYDLFPHEMRNEDEIEAARSNPNFRSVDAGHAMRETRHFHIQPNNSLESDRNFSTWSYSCETSFASLATPLTIQCDATSFDPSTSDSVAGAQQSVSGVSEENQVNFFLAPVETTRGEFNDNQWNPFEHFSSQLNVGWSDWRTMPQEEIINTRFEASESYRKIENELTEPQKKLSHSLSIARTQATIESAVSAEGTQTAEDYRGCRSPSAIFPLMDDIPSIEMSTDRVSLGSVSDAEAVSVSVPSGIDTPASKTGKEKLFVCHVCKNTFATQGELQVHSATHKGVKIFSCHLCGKRYTNKTSLTRHLKLHSGEGTHDCPECGKKFGQKSERDAHTRTHIKEKPFACDTCDKAFAQKQNLNTHLRTHTKEKSFNCGKCNRGFAHKENLAAHLRTHTGEKPYTCEVCGKDFTRKRSFREHRNREHGGGK